MWHNKGKELLIYVIRLSQPEKDEEMEKEGREELRRMILNNRTHLHENVIGSWFYSINVVDVLGFSFFFFFFWLLIALSHSVFR